MLAALQAGRVDIVSMDATVSAKAVQQGLGYVVVNTSDPAATEKYWPRQLGSAYVTTKQFAEQNPQLLQDFVAGLVDGQARTLEAADDPAAVLALMRPEQQASSPTRGRSSGRSWARRTRGPTGRCRRTSCATR
ncbi:hypothetical protein BJF78_00505 [Pseudonocardia sp. CNS-139]|nr:hypothetical protein BJF78_00505 [Pseudonocardia sp. CNS-139]